MTKWIALAFALAFATSAQAMTPIPVHEPANRVVYDSYLDGETVVVFRSLVRIILTGLCSIVAISLMALFEEVRVIAFRSASVARAMGCSPA